MKQDYEVLKSDVLVIGAGMGGLSAAIRAKDFAKDVILVEKGNVTRSGVSVFCHAYGAPVTQEFFEPLLKETVKRSGYLGDQAWFEILLSEIGERSRDMEKWGVITADYENGEPVYSPDDVIIGRLLVDMDNLGFGPRDGYDPKDLKGAVDFIRNYIEGGHNKYQETYLEKSKSADHEEKGSQHAEVMSLFFYYMYRKLVQEYYKQVQKSSIDKKDPCPA